MQIKNSRGTFKHRLVKHYHIVFILVEGHLMFYEILGYPTLPFLQRLFLSIQLYILAEGFVIPGDVLWNHCNSRWCFMDSLQFQVMFYEILGYPTLPCLQWLFHSIQLYILAEGHLQFQVMFYEILGYPTLPFLQRLFLSTQVASARRRSGHQLDWALPLFPIKASLNTRINGL